MLLFMGIGTQELLFIALIVLLLFGGKKIHELMTGPGPGGIIEAVYKNFPPFPRNHRDFLTG